MVHANESLRTGLFIRKERRKKGMRQSELSKLTGLKQPNISRIENGFVSPRASTLEKIATALSIEVKVLLEAPYTDIERDKAEYENILPFMKQLLVIIDDCTAYLTERDLRFLLEQRNVLDLNCGDSREKIESIQKLLQSRKLT